MGRSIKGLASKHTLTEKAYACIKEGIVRGEIEEGVFLSEEDIMKRYGIGRTPFREACNRLHHELSVEIIWQYSRSPARLSCAGNELARSARPV